MPWRKSMSAFPISPFLTDRFDTEGGGIDFLGMRQVNLSILQEELIPGINNQTADLGTFCLGTWIPWKFRELCGDDARLFTDSRYRAFREAVEVVMAYVTRDGSPGNARFGKPRTRIGVQQKLRPPAPLTFRAGKRTDATTLYAAALYGPSLRFVRLIAGDALAEDGSSTEIPLASDDRWTREIVSEVERRLARCPESGPILRLEVPTPDSDTLDALGLHGLHAASYRQGSAPLEAAFIRKFLVGDGRDPMTAGRRRTALLICETVRQHPTSSPDQLRGCWYTNLLPTGRPLVLADQELQDHRLTWAIFQARQVQRTAVEGFLRCFELALASGSRNIKEVLAHWTERSPPAFASVAAWTFADFVHVQASAVCPGGDHLAASRAWQAMVHAGHALYEDTDPPGEDEELLHYLGMLARWWLRVQAWIHDGVRPGLLTRGDRERMSIHWLSEWLRQRLTRPVRDLLCGLWEDAVFAQHIRWALIRFDSEIQRLRFTLGDEGIIPTAEAQDRLGAPPVRTADRLPAFIGILRDVEVLEENEAGVLSPGGHASILREKPDDAR
jgi:hypothetical protein